MKQLTNRLLNHRHASRTTHHHHALDIFNGNMGIAQRFFNSTQGALRKRLRLRFKNFTAYIQTKFTIRQQGMKFNTVF
jgi:hypothetical protein